MNCLTEDSFLFAKFVLDLWGRCCDFGMWDFTATVELAFKTDQKFNAVKIKLIFLEIILSSLSMGIFFLIDEP